MIFLSSENSGRPAVNAAHDFGSLLGISSGRSAIKLGLEPHPEFGGSDRLEERAKRFFKFPDIRVAEVIELFAEQVASVAALSARN
jgi:hypothetical protein